MRRRSFLLIPAGVSLAGCVTTWNFREVDKRTDRIAFDRGKTGMARLELRMAAGELNVQSGAQRLFEGELTYDGVPNKPIVDFNDSSFRGVLKISHPKDIRSPRESRWDVKVAEGVPLDVEVHLGAGRAGLELGNASLKNLTVHMGAGEVIADLRGETKNNISVTVHGGVGHAVVRLPKDANVEAEAKGGLGEINVRGLESRGAGRYTRKLSGSAAPTITVEVHGGIGQIELRADS